VWWGRREGNIVNLVVRRSIKKKRKTKIELA
jgi:hypothetical protein